MTVCIQTRGMGFLGQEDSGYPYGQDYISLGVLIIVPSKVLLPPQDSGLHFSYHSAPNFILVLRCFSCIPATLKSKIFLLPPSGHPLILGDPWAYLATSFLRYGDNLGLAPGLDGGRRKERRTNPAISMLWCRSRPSLRRQGVTYPFVSSVHGDWRCGGAESASKEAGASRRVAKTWGSRFCSNQDFHGWCGWTGCLNCEQQKHKQLQNVYRLHVPSFKAVSPDATL